METLHRWKGCETLLKVQELQFGAGHQEDEMQIEENRKNLKNKERSINAKLPKLVITKFNGMHTYWPRLWNHFKAEIDLADVHVRLLSSCRILRSYWSRKLGQQLKAFHLPQKAINEQKTY